MYRSVSDELPRFAAFLRLEVHFIRGLSTLLRFQASQTPCRAPIPKSLSLAYPDHRFALHGPSITPARRRSGLNQAPPPRYSAPVAFHHRVQHSSHKICGFSSRSGQLQPSLRWSPPPPLRRLVPSLRVPKTSPRNLRQQIYH